VYDEIVFTVNSPGEVSTWLGPTVAAVRRLRGTEPRVSVHILPCLYASGTEADVIRRMPGVDHVVPPGESLRYILWGTIPGAWRPTGRGVLVFLGGEMFLAARLARRLGYPAVAYTHGHVVSPGAFSWIFVPREAAKARAIEKGASPERVRVVGDLMVDAAGAVQDPEERERLVAPLKLDRGGATVLILPGSRPYELRLVLPLLASAAARLAREMRDVPVQFLVALSPYITREVLARALKPRQEELDGGPAASWASESAAAALETLFQAEHGGVRAEIALETSQGPVTMVFWRGASRAAMAAADLALTIPGSNTAELAAWGVPMIVCLPLHRPEEIPLEGIAGYLDRLPLIGRRLKIKAVLQAAERARYVALPNQVAGEVIVPELRSRRLLPEDVAEEAKRLLSDPARLRAMASRLAQAMGPQGAAERVAREAFALLQK